MNLKKIIFGDVLNHLKEARTTLDSQIERTKYDIVNASCAMSSRYDTFREEGNFLLTGLLKDKSHSDEILQKAFEFELKPCVYVQQGALVRVFNHKDYTEEGYFCLPFGHGFTNTYENQEYTVISLDSPIGKALKSKREYDFFLFRDKKYSIDDIQ